MKRYDEMVLHKLLDKYENSALYSGRNQRSQRIAFLVGRKTLPEYFDEGSLQFSVIHDQLLELEEKGFLELVWKNKKVGHILEKCILCPEKAEEIYALLRRTPKNDKEQEIRNICARQRGKHPLLDDFLDYTEMRLEEGHSIAQYVDFNHPEAFDRLCFLVLKILENERETFLREFSVSWQHDSKAAEKEIAGAVGVIRRFWKEGEFQELETEQILEEFNIFRNPVWVILKGEGSFFLGESCLELQNFFGGIGLSSQDIEKVRWKKQRRPVRILTIENLTSFHRFQEENTLCIYLGGYHNRAKRSFLQKLYETYPAAKYEHFGDIDCGGFRIYQDLCLKTGIPFAVRWMDEATYEAYAAYGKKLTDHDRRELERMMQDSFFKEQHPLFHRMLQRGVKVEQECVRN